MRLILAVLALSLAAATATAADLVETASPHSVARTVANFEAAVAKAGAKVFATVDHAAGARSIGAELPETTLIIFGNPRIGTPTIAAQRSTGLDLPLRVLVWDDAGQTRVTYEPPQAMFERHGVTGADDTLAKMKGALAKLTAAAVKQ